MGRRTSTGLVSILLLLAATFVFAKFQGGFVSWFIFYAYLPVALLAMIQYFFGLSKVTVERQVSHSHCQSGETVEVRLVIHNPYRLPLVYLTITDELPSGLDQERSKVTLVAYPGMRRTYHLSYQVGPVSRGYYQWKSLELSTGDFFGLVKSIKQVENRARLTVYPRYQTIEVWEIANGKGWGRYQSSNWSNKGEETPFVIGVRDYVAGDRLARIHWKASARSSGLKSKEFEHQMAHDVMLFLNREQIAYGFGHHHGFERAVTWCASLAHYAITHHFSCGLVSSGSVHTVIPLKQGGEQKQRIFEHLVHVKADASYPFAQTVVEEAVHLPPGTTLVLITPVLNHQLLKVMVDLAYRRIQVQLFLIKDKEPSKEEETLLASLPRKGIHYYTVTSDRFPARLVRRREANVYKPFTINN